MTKGTGKGGEPRDPSSEPEVCAFRRALRRERGTGDLRRTALEELLLPLPLLRAMADARALAKERRRMGRRKKKGREISTGTRNPRPNPNSEIPWPWGGSGGVYPGL